jgi:hypothetical protein
MPPKVFFKMIHFKIIFPSAPVSVFPSSCITYLTYKVHIFCAVLCYLVWPVWLYHIFPHYLIPGNIFGHKVIKHKMRVLIFCPFFFFFFFKHFSFSAILSEMLSQIYVRLHVKYWLYSLDLNKTRISMTYFQQIFKYQIS